MNGYDWYDLWNESYNEAKRAEYKKASKKLSNYLQQINRYITAAENGFNGFNKVYSYDSAFLGEIPEGFGSKSAEYEKKIKGYINNLKSARDLIANREYKCRLLYDSYCKACEEEDIRGRREWEANH